MKPVFQSHTDLSQPELGDCLSACVASILELPLEEVPKFCHPESDWPQNYCSWFGDRGLVAIELKWPAGRKDFKLNMPLPVGTYFIAHFSRPHFDWQHSVVAVYDGTMPDGYSIVHDPNPDGGDLGELRGFAFIALKEPWKHTNKIAFTPCSLLGRGA
jgi:hypothetical protein